MSKYNEQYYIAFEPKGDDRIFAAPDYQTDNRNYDFEKLSLDGPPLAFLNSNRDNDKKKGVSWPITENMVVLGDLLVNKAIKEELNKYDVSGMLLYPSTYIDDDGNMHNEYWFLNFYESLDCWSRNDSRPLSRKICGEQEPEILKYSLDEKKLDSIDEEKRMVFKMGGCAVEYIFVHKNIVEFYNECGFEGVQFLKVSEFSEGDQY